MAVLAGVVTLWVTFLPCFLWIFAGAPYLERLTSHPRIASALRSVTAAVVGVILSLSLFFAMHVFFGEVEPGNGSYVLPVLETFRPVAVLLTAIAGVLMLGFGRGVLSTLAVMIPVTLALTTLF